MPFRAQCPAGHTLMIPDHRAGTRIRCAKCSVAFDAPGVAKVENASSAFERSPNEFDVIREREALSEPAPTTERGPRPPEPRQGKHVTVPIKSSVDVTVTSPQPIPTPVVHPAATTETDPEPPPIAQSAPRVNVAPWSPDENRRYAAIMFACAVVALGVFNCVPAVWEWFAIWQGAKPTITPPWVYATLSLSVLLIGYGVYLAQLPDWAALWMTTFAVLGSAATYATLLGTTLLGGDESFLVVLLRFSDKLPGNRASMWCFVMLAFSSVVAYFLGQAAARWHHGYRLLAEVHQPEMSSSL